MPMGSNSEKKNFNLQSKNLRFKPLYHYLCVWEIYHNINGARVWLIVTQFPKSSSKEIHRPSGLKKILIAYVLGLEGPIHDSEIGIIQSGVRNVFVNKLWFDPRWQRPPPKPIHDGEIGEFIGGA